MSTRDRNIRSALMIARRGRAPGGSLSDAISSFSKDREAQLNRPASGASDAALMAALEGQHPQLAVAEPMEQRRAAPVSSGVGDLGAQIDEGAKWLSGQPEDDAGGATKVSPTNRALQDPRATSAAPRLAQPRVALTTDGTSQPSATGAPQVSHILDFVGKADGGGSYNSYYAHANNNSVDLTGMSLNDVLNFQRDLVTRQGLPSAAAGRYQFMPQTLKGLMGQMQLTGDEQFDPKMQDQLATQLLKNRGLDDWQAGKLSDGQFMNNLAHEWAALPVPATGQSAYESHLNHATVGVGQTANMLREARGLPTSADGDAPNAQPPAAQPSRTAQADAPAIPPSAPAYGPFGTNAKPGFADFKFDPNDTEDMHIPGGSKTDAAPSALAPTPGAPPPASLQDATGGPQAKADQLLDPDAAQTAQRGGTMRRKHFDDGGDSGGDSAGDSAATAAGVAAGYGGVGDANGAPDGTSTNSGVTGFGGMGDGDATGVGDSVGYGSSTSGNGGSPSAGHGVGMGSSGVGSAANSGGAGAGGGNGAAGSGGNGTGGGGGTASGGSGPGGNGAGNGIGLGGTGGAATMSQLGPDAQDLRSTINAYFNSQGLMGQDTTQSLGVPPGLLSGVGTATSPVTVSQLGPPTTSPAQQQYAATMAAAAQMRGGNAPSAPSAPSSPSPSQVAAINALMAARGGASASSAPSAPSAPGPSTVGFQTVGFGDDAPSAPSAPAPSPNQAQQQYAATMAAVSAMRGSPSQAVNAPSAPSQAVNAPAPAQQNQAQQVQAPAPAPAPAPTNNSNRSSGRYGTIDPSGVGRHNRGGVVNLASGGIASIPTDELIELALQRIQQRRKAASGGAQSSSKAAAPVSTGQILAGEGMDWSALAPDNDPGNPNYAYELGLGPMGESPSSGSDTPAPMPTPTPNTPAIPSGVVGNHSGASGSPIGGVPNAVPTVTPALNSSTSSSGPQYSNTLNQVLGTNSPNMDQIFGFTYPTPPAPKAQPVGPVSQNEINGLYGFGGGSQEGTGTFQGGGAVIMDAALNKARKAIKGNKRHV